MTGDLQTALDRATAALGGDERRALQYVRNVAHVDRLEDVPSDLVGTVCAVLHRAAEVALRDRRNGRSADYHYANAARINLRRRAAYAARKRA